MLRTTKVKKNKLKKRKTPTLTQHHFTLPYPPPSPTSSPHLPSPTAAPPIYSSIHYQIHRISSPKRRNTISGLLHSLTHTYVPCRKGTNARTNTYVRVRPTCLAAAHRRSVCTSLALPTSHDTLTSHPLPPETTAPTNKNRPLASEAEKKPTTADRFDSRDFHLPLQ